MTGRALFEQIGEIIRGSTPTALGRPHVHVRSNGVKAWFGDPAPQREHYEAQIISADIAPGTRTCAIEIGFHAEHRDEPVTGVFLGRDTWRRISETWPDPDLDDPDVPFDIGVRLVDYIRALEPHRRRV